MMGRSKICSGKARFEMFLVQDLLTSPARRRMTDSLNDGLQPDFVYNFCAYIDQDKKDVKLEFSKS